MIKDFIIGNYRGLQNLALEHLNKINIFVGPNNCGKTSILEAVILSGLFDDVDLLVDTLISRYHGFSPEHFESLFSVGHEPVICLKSRMSNTDKVLHTHLMYKKEQIISKDETASRSTVFELRFLYGYDGINEEKQDKFFVRFEEGEDGFKAGMGKSPNNILDLHIPCKFVSFSRFDSSARLINDIDKILDRNLRQELINILKIFDDKINNFEIVGKDRTIKLFKENQAVPLTLYDYGNGMYKAFFIAASALLSKDGILLVDEIEAAEGITDCSFLEAVLEKYLGFIQYQNAKELPLFFEQMIGK
ncbi:AAA family ATPase [Lachnospiraceae bacterium 62-35]